MNLRAIKLIYDAIDSFKLNLEGLTVLTEAASGNYQYNSLLAAKAGANVFTITKNSSYGNAEEIINNTKANAASLGLRNIRYIEELTDEIIGGADIITNSGFVRPILRPMIEKMKPTAVIPLMWETWELRENELDLMACKENGVLVMGTDEGHAPLQLYGYVGHIAQKMIYEMGFEGFKTKVLLLGSNPMGNLIKDQLQKSGSKCEWYSNYDTKARSYHELKADFEKEGHLYDVLIVAEHKYPEEILGQRGILTPKNLKKINPHLSIGIIAGNIDVEGIKAYGFGVYPEKILPFGFVSYDTYKLGPRPVIDLFAAGLKVGQEMANCRLSGKSISETLDYMTQIELSMEFVEGLSFR